jgi:hypothetical protein
VEQPSPPAEVRSPALEGKKGLPYLIQGVPPETETPFNPLLAEDPNDRMIPISEAERANTHLSEDGQLLLANTPSFTFKLPAFWRTEGQGENFVEGSADSPPVVLSTPHCKTCRFWQPFDERGPLWSAKGFCGFPLNAVKFDAAAEFWCQNFLFNENLREGNASPDNK